MNLRDFLLPLRRRLLVVVVALAVGLVGGWFSASGRPVERKAFRATHTLIYESRTPANRSYNIDQVAVLASSGAVPSRVAGRLNVSRSEVRGAVSAVADAKVGMI
jgi:hypothetical protein